MSKIRNRKPLNKRERPRFKLLAGWLAYSDEVQIRRVELDLNEFYHVIFFIKCPKSWSQKKREAHWFTRHQSRPDKDNLEKGLLDILYGEDCAAWDGRVTKVWAPEGFIAVSKTDFDVSPASLRSIIEVSR